MLKKFVPHVKKFCQDHGIEYKVLLLLDNAPAHPSAEKLTSCDGKVTTMYLYCHARVLSYVASITYPLLFVIVL